MPFFYRSLFAWIILAITISAVDAKPYECSDFGYSGIERPKRPACFEFRFETDSVFRMGREEMESYKSSMQRYLDCLKAESGEAIEEYNLAVESFNCAAQGHVC
jgi:hypothetical protein